MGKALEMLIPTWRETFGSIDQAFSFLCDRTRGVKRESECRHLRIASLNQSRDPTTGRPLPLCLNLIIYSAREGRDCWNDTMKQRVQSWACVSSLSSSWYYNSSLKLLPMAASDHFLSCRFPFTMLIQLKLRESSTMFQDQYDQGVSRNVLLVAMATTDLTRSIQTQRQPRLPFFQWDGDFSSGRPILELVRRCVSSSNQISQLVIHPIQSSFDAFSSYLHPPHPRHH
jgi:hypothetical protein